MKNIEHIYYPDFKDYHPMQQGTATSSHDPFFLLLSKK
jgi:hypothetical protein